MLRVFPFIVLFDPPIFKGKLFLFSVGKSKQRAYEFLLITDSKQVETIDVIQQLRSSKQILLNFYIICVISFEMFYKFLKNFPCAHPRTTTTPYHFVSLNEKKPSQHS